MTTIFSASATELYSYIIRQPTISYSAFCTVCKVQFLPVFKTSTIFNATLSTSSIILTKTMSHFSQLALNMFNNPAATKEHDYSSVIRRSREEPKGSNIKSLTVLTGRRFVQEAHLFFEELQAGLSSIDIQGGSADALWCMLDWHRYILAVWTEQFMKASILSDTKWMDIKESWETMVQAAVSLQLKYAFPSENHQRSAFRASTDSLSFEESLHNSRIFGSLNREDENLMDAIIRGSMRFKVSRTLVLIQCPARPIYLSFIFII